MEEGYYQKKNSAATQLHNQEDWGGWWQAGMDILLSPPTRWRLRLQKAKGAALQGCWAWLNLLLPESWFIGDKPSDEEAGKVAGCRTIMKIEYSWSIARSLKAAFGTYEDNESGYTMKMKIINDIMNEKNRRYSSEIPFLTTHSNTVAVILAGGLGTRLRSVISDRPKPMAEIGGKPFLEYLVNRLLSYQFSKIVTLRLIHERKYYWLFWKPLPKICQVCNWGTTARNSRCIKKCPKIAWWQDSSVKWRYVYTSRLPKTDAFPQLKSRRRYPDASQRDKFTVRQGSVNRL